MIISSYSNFEEDFAISIEILFDPITTTVVQNINEWLTTSLLGSKDSLLLLQLKIIIFWYAS